MASSNSDYYRKRIEQETRRAELETNMSVRHVHQTLANMYRVRLNAEERAAREVPQTKRPALTCEVGR